jgi:hypothetical protein
MEMQAERHHAPPRRLGERLLRRGLVPESFIRERRVMPLRSRPLPLLATKLQTG